MSALLSQTSSLEHVTCACRPPSAVCQHHFCNCHLTHSHFPAAAPSADGLHYYEVKDAEDRPYLLGIGPHGIAQYDVKDMHKPRKSWGWLSLTNVSWKKNRFFLELEEPSRLSSAGIINMKYIWKTNSPTQSDLMLKMVHFQHTNSLRCEKLTETRRREEYLASNGSSGQASGFASPAKTAGFANGAGAPSGILDSPHIVPAAHEVNLPAAASSVTKLLEEARNTPKSNSSPVTVRTFDVGGSSRRTVSTTSLNIRSTLDGLERRRDQILAELARKRQQLEGFISEEQEFTSAPTTAGEDELPPLPPTDDGEGDAADTIAGASPGSGSSVDADPPPGLRGRDSRGGRPRGSSEA